MCRNIKPLFNYDPPSTEADVQDAARQFVRKVAGFTKPSQANQAAFDRAIREVSTAIDRFLADLTTAAPPHDRQAEIERAKARSAERYA